MATTSAIDVVMPQMGVSVAEGTIIKWLKREGDAVAADEPLLEISTDKVDTEVPSPGAGVLQQILVQEGETVAVGTKIAVIAPGGTPSPAPAPAPEQRPEPDAAPEESAEPEPPAAEVASPYPETRAEEPEVVAEAKAETAGPETGDSDGDSDGEHAPFVSPVVARIAAEQGVDVAQVRGTGQGGRVTKKDILAFIDALPAPPSSSAQPAASTPPPAAPAPAPAAPAAAAAGPAPAQAGEGELAEPMTPMRRGIAEHMRRSLDTAAHVTSAIEVDMSKVVRIREKLKGEYQSAYGVNPTYLAFVARATVDTLKDWPWINGELRGDKIVTRQYVNLGIAVALEGGKGLIVPVIKNTEGMNLLGIARAIKDIAAKARDKKLLPDDVQGGTFTITNPGSFGTFHGTPVISQPQAGILGTYALVKRPWVVQDDLGQDTIAIRPIMNITLTYDHRLVDGAYAGQFLHDLRERLQSWDEERY